MPDYEQSVFISYAWGGEREDVVNAIDETLQQKGIRIVRDKRVLGYRGSIREFMERIGRGSCIIVVISDKYLRSPNCMFELVEIADNKEFHDRIFPVVLSDAKIYDPIERLEYVRYWEMKRQGLAQAMKDVDPANLQGIREDIDLYDRIRDKVSGLTSILKDMNTLTPDMHRDSEFSNLYDAIVERLKEGSIDNEKPASKAMMYGIGVIVLLAIAGIAINALIRGGNREAPISTPTLGIGSSMIFPTDGMTMVYVPRGEFTMGSEIVPDEQPPHTIYLDHYWIDKTEVTNEKYYQCVNAGDCNPPSNTDQFGVDEYANHPVVYVSWNDANAYCAWADRRLPTEAEWEKAARGTDERTYPWGNETPSSDLLNFKDIVGKTTEVGKYPGGASPYGAMDMAGSVSEWVQDWYGADYYAQSPATNPLGPDSGVDRIRRGGSFRGGDRTVRTAARVNYDPASKESNTGFRCAVSATP